MTDPMTSAPNRVEIITSVRRRRRWTAAEKVRLVEATFAPGMTVSLVARRNGIAPNQLFTWRRLAAQGALTAAGAGEEVVPASDYRALQNQVRELQRLLGKKSLEAGILGGARSRRRPRKGAVAVGVAASGRFAVRAVAGVLGVARPNLVERMGGRPRRRLGRPPAPADALVAEIEAVVADLPTYGYRRVHAILRRRALAEGRQPPNHERVYRVMKEHGLLLRRHAGGAERRHDGRIAVEGPICAGARTRSRSGARTASGSAWPSPWTAATGRRWATWPRPAGSGARRFAT